MPDRILIVEDQRITAEDLHDILTGLGYVVTAVVSSGADAIREVERDPPDLVLMDIRIKGEMDGAETARILHERFKTPVVYLTAHVDRETLTRAKQAKPLGYIVKPYKESGIQAAVEMALHRHKHETKVGKRQQHLTGVLGSLLLGVISVDGSEVVVLFNPAAEDLTGWTEAEALGWPARKVFRLIDVKTGEPTSMPLSEVLFDGALREIRGCMLMRKSGELREISGNVSPIPGSTGESRGAVIIFEPADPAPENPFLAAKIIRTTQGEALLFERFHLVAASEEMKKAITFALRVARSEATTILIEGESGTGKDLMAQFIHYSSNRLSGPYVCLNCAAIAESLVESELFGHQKGSSTDARAEKKGLFEMASGGTLFLDEIGELTLPVQAKLLRVLENQTFRRVGGAQEVQVDVRIIATTNRNLAECVQHGLFRADLFHRLSVIPIAIPPLRQRSADILPLARHFLREYAAKYKSKVASISPGAIEVLTNHVWPGNVRELRNVIERAVLMEDTESLLPESIQLMFVPKIESQVTTHPESTALTKLSLSDSERGLVRQALQKTGWNQTKAAVLLGITRDMLRSRIKKLGLTRDDP